MRAESLAAGRRGRHTVVGRFEGDDGMRSKRAGGSAVAWIQDLILAEGLAPGDPMPTEGALCEQLGISRSSVREAMRTLASLDIVEVRHGHGTFVGQLSLSPLRSEEHTSELQSRPTRRSSDLRADQRSRGSRT